MTHHLVKRERTALDDYGKASALCTQGQGGWTDQVSSLARISSKIRTSVLGQSDWGVVETGWVHSYLRRLLQIKWEHVGG